MPKYIIEGSLDFYNELYKSLDDPINEKIDKNAVNELCLITNAPLTENFVTLGCNHKFNYEAIYNDIYSHKKNYNSMERLAVKQKQIRCPYCRTIHNELLPYIEGYQKVHGVNHFDETQENVSQSYCSPYSDYVKGICCYVPFKINSPDDNSSPPPKCGNCYVKMFQVDGKHYCSSHYSLRIKEVYNANKLKEKMEKKQIALIEKQKIKDEKIKAKLEEKIKKQEEKMKKQSDKKLAKTNNIKNENFIISSSQQSSLNTGEIDETKCIEILKSGKNKGKQCGCKIVSQSFCGRHNKEKSAQEQS